MLNRILYQGWPFRASDNEIASASRATVSVPAAGPYNRADVKTKVSETEIVAGTEGSFTVADPVTSVRIARTNQFQLIGSAYSEYTECPRMSIPANATA